MFEPHTALFVAPAGVGETHLALDLLKKEYKNHFDFIIIICPMLKHNSTYPQGMRSFEQYDETRKYFTEGKQKDNNANEVQKHLQLHDLSIGEYLTDKYALWLDFRTIDENNLHGVGRRIGNASEGITLQIEKKAESAGSLNAYIYLIMDAQLNIQNGAFVFAIY